MMSLKQKVHEQDWDNLLVLDAARYDFFQEFYDIYPNLEKGELQKVKSPGSATPEVLPKLFTEEYNWKVLASNPFLNDEGIGVDDWKAENHFSEIVKVWKTSESKDDGVVTPENMASAVIKNYDPDRRNLVWFMQPHNPHIGTISVSFGRKIPGIFEAEGGIDPSLAKAIRVSYKYNLLRVLFTVSDLIGALEGKTVITADHGELLFDERSVECFRHPKGSDHPKLREVPWLELDSDKAVSHSKLSDRSFIQLVYTTVLGREPGKEGIDNYLEKLETTMSRRDLIEVLLASEEYSERYGDPDKICGLEDSWRMSG